MFDEIKEILISEKQLTEINYKRLQVPLLYKKSILIDSDGVMYLTFGSLKEEHITTLNNITLEKVKVKPYGFDKMYMDKELIEDKL